MSTVKDSLRQVIIGAKSFESGEIDERKLKDLIFKYLSEEDEILPNMMLLLDSERKSKNQLIIESNAELSRAVVTLIDDKYANKGAIVDRFWVAAQIKTHYLKWKDTIRCCFKIDGFPE